MAGGITMSLIAWLRGRPACAGLVVGRRQQRRLRELGVLRVFKPVPGPGEPQRRAPVPLVPPPPFTMVAGIAMVPGELFRRPWERLLHLGRRAGAAASMLSGSEFRCARLARRAYLQLRRGAPGVAASIAERFVAEAGPAYGACAADLREAVGAADLESAARVAHHAELLPDIRSQKIVSRRHRFLWIANTKVASRSLVNALCRADPDVELFTNCSVDDVLTLRPEARGYFSFAFVRDPFRRAVSLYGHKFLREPPPATGLARRFHGLSAGMDFEAFCAWLAGPYGADAFADRHWLSQHIQIATAVGRMPDFVGRHETIEDDLRTVTRRVGLPDLRLPLINTAAGWGWEPSRQKAEAARRALETLLTDRARELLSRRYADDFRIFGYDPERPLRA